MSHRETIERMARAMCASAACDPDVMTWPGILLRLNTDGMQFTVAPSGWQADEMAPAWMRFIPQAEAAFKAMTEETAKES